MATTYVERRNVLTDIVQRYVRARNQIEAAAPAAQLQVDRAKADLDDIPTSLKRFLDDIATDGASNPDNLPLKLMAEEAITTINDVSTLSARADEVSKYLTQVPIGK